MELIAYDPPLQHNIWRQDHPEVRLNACTHMHTYTHAHTYISMTQVTHTHKCDTRTHTPIYLHHTNTALTGGEVARLIDI